MLTTVRFLALGTAAVVLAAMHLRRPLLVCPFRTLTGIPCPLCGGTTAAMTVGAGDLARAVRVAPVPLLAAATFIVAPLGPANWWWRLAPRRRAGLIMAALVVAECWQLVRLGVAGP